MARARNIKPGLFRNEVLGVADPLYTLLFEGLWLLADRAGRLEDRPLRIKADIFPYRDGINADSMLGWLQNNKFIQRYHADGVAYIQILAFEKHQNPHKNEPESVIPAPSDSASEEIGTSTEEIGSTRACSLIPDSGFLIPDTSASDKPPPKARKRASFDAKAIELPAWLPSDVWDSWVHDRKVRGKPLTEAAATLSVKKLDEFRRQGFSPQSVIEHCIANGYQGLFAPAKAVAQQPAPAHEIYKPEPPMTPEERAKANAARELALSAFKGVRRIA